MESDVKYLQKYRDRSEEQFVVLGQISWRKCEIINVIISCLLQNEMVVNNGNPLDVFLTFS